MRQRSVLFWMICGAFFFSANVQAQSLTGESRDHKFKVDLLHEGRDVIWGFDFLPGGNVIMTERKGELLRLDPATKKVEKIIGVPAVYANGQGGLLDVRVHPDVQKNSLIYFTYSEPIGDFATTALARAKLVGTELKEFKRLFSAAALSRNNIHFGSRIVFDRKGHIFLGVGERGERDKAQGLSAHNGKIIRLMDDGSVPKDNPFVKNKKALHEIWTYGHRNPQGLAIHPETGTLWENEFGPRGGDELNRIQAGKNYGWPVITYGREYHGPKIGEGTHKAGMEQPAAYWVPSISPSGMNFYFGKAFPKWRGNLFIGCLSGQHLRRVVLDGNKTSSQEELLGDLHWRIRNVREGPDGFLYLSTDEGRLARLTPN